MHTGTAQAGHYYSYIEINENRWLEFNDSRVSEFDFKNIEQECFGGSSGKSDDAWIPASDNNKERSKNAYILIYEKLVKTDL